MSTYTPPQAFLMCPKIWCHKIKLFNYTYYFNGIIYLLFKYIHTLVGFMSTYPFYSSMAISTCPKYYVATWIQTIQLHILFQWDQNYFLQSNILFTQYILTPVHPLNTTYEIIYLNTLWVGLCPNIPFTPPHPFIPVQIIMSQDNSYSYTYYFNFTPPWPFPTCPKFYSSIMSKKLQHNSNYSTTHIISMGSKLFPSVKYTFHSIYSNTSPSTKHNLWNNLFKHTLGEFMSTYPFYSSMAISPCPKYYVTTQFKLFNYTYYFNGIKIISFSQIYFSLNIF